MEQNQLLQKSILFCNLKSDEIEQVLDCLGYYKKRYQKNQMIISQGESSHTIGVILSGIITICKSYMEEDLTELRTMCKCQYINVGFLQNIFVGKPTFLFCIFYEVYSIYFLIIGV